MLLRPGVGKLRLLATAVSLAFGNIGKNLPVALLADFSPLSLLLFLEKYSNVLTHNDIRSREV
jgi:hypothetical protein